MTDLNVNTDVTDAVIEVTASPSDRLLIAAKLVARTVARVTAIDTLLADQTIALSTSKQRVTEALANGGTGFDEASRAFKAANNKLDKLLESRESLVGTAQLDLDAARDTIAAVQAQLRGLSD